MQLPLQIDRPKNTHDKVNQPKRVNAVKVKLLRWPARSAQRENTKWHEIVCTWTMKEKRREKTKKLSKTSEWEGDGIRERDLNH